MKGRIEINSELCKGCGLCIIVCRKKLIEISSQLNKKGYYPAKYKEEDVADESCECTGCVLCALTCPDIAIEVYRQEKEAEKHSKTQDSKEG